MAGAAVDHEGGDGRASGKLAELYAKCKPYATNPYANLASIDCPEPPLKIPSTTKEWTDDFLLPGHAEFLLERKHAHPKDKLIFFDEAPHKYYIKPSDDGLPGDETKGSVSGLCHPYFAEFDKEGTIVRMLRNPQYPSAEKYKRYRKNDGKGMNADEIRAMWDLNSALASNQGTWMHFQIELFFNGLPHDRTTKEMKHFLRWYQEWLRPKGIVPYRTEWEIFSWKHLIAGTIDFVGYGLNDEGEDWFRAKIGLPPREKGDAPILATEDPRLWERIEKAMPELNLEKHAYIVIIDWKRSKNVYKEDDTMLEAAKLRSEGKEPPPNRWRKFGKPPLDHLEDTSFTHYCLQVRTYQRILEMCYGLTVRACYICAFHPDWDRYVVWEAPDFSKEVRSMFDLREKELESIVDRLEAKREEAKKDKSKRVDQLLKSVVLGSKRRERSD